MTTIVILGAGTGGTLTANRLRRACGDDTRIVVVDQDDRHLYQPGLLFVPSGSRERTASSAPAQPSSTTASSSGSPRSITSSPRTTRYSSRAGARSPTTCS